MLRIAIEALIAILFLGCTPVVVKSISANPYTIGIFRLAVATLVLGAAMALRGQLKRVSPRDVLRLAIIGGLFCAHWLTIFIAVKTSSASIASIGISTYGADLLILGAIFTKQRTHASDVIAVIVAAIGAVLVVPAFDLRNDVVLGMLVGSLSALLYAGLPLLHQRWSHLSSATRTLGQFGFGLLFFLCFLPKAEWRLGARDWAGLLFLAIGTTLIAHSLWVRITTRLSPSATSIVYYGSIPVGILLGILVLREPLTMRAASGAMLIIGGGVWGLMQKARRTPAIAAPPDL